MHYITQEDYGDIHLTDEGRYLAQSVYERHVTLTAFFNEFLGVDAEIEFKIVEELSSEINGKFKTVISQL